jgi:hypothetical protein
MACQPSAREEKWTGFQYAVSAGLWSPSGSVARRENDSDDEASKRNGARLRPAFMPLTFLLAGSSSVLRGGVQLCAAADFW